MMLEYALRGCENGQLHTYFQVPDKNYKMKKGGRISKAMHELIFNPQDGLLAGLIYLNEKGLLENQKDIIKFYDVVELYKKHNLFDNWDGDII